MFHGGRWELSYIFGGLARPCLASATVHAFAYLQDSDMLTETLGHFNFG